jgi:ketosteroid isomerase-like protein
VHQVTTQFPGRWEVIEHLTPLDEVIHPFNARLRTPLVPTVRDIFADGDTVLTLFDAADGLPYRNTYTWYFWMTNGKVVKAIAFFDTRLR